MLALDDSDLERQLREQNGRSSERPEKYV